MLPDAVLQNMGASPPPFDASLAGMPPDGGYGLHPAVLQGLGYQPPPMPPDVAPAPVLPISAAPIAPPPPSADVNLPPPIPAGPAPGPGVGGPLPSMVGRPPEPAIALPDIHLPPPAVLAPPAPAARQAPPARPQTVEQAMAANQAALTGATQEEKAAVAAQTQAQQGAAAGQLAAEQNYATHEAELQQQAAAQRDEALKAHAAAQRTVEDRMKALDNYKIDQGKYWNSMGVGEHIGWYIGIALSQIGNALMGKGGENPVMSMLQDKLKQSIVMQQDQRDQMGKGVDRAKELMQNSDLYQAKRASDIAAAQADATKMLKIQVDLATAKAADPTIRANGQLESAKLDRQLANDQQTATEKLANYNIQKQQVGIAGGHLALAQQQFKLDVAWKGWQQNREQQQLDLAAAKEALAERKAIGEKDRQLGVTATIPDAQGGAQTGMLLNKDGSVWHANKPEEATKVQNMVAATQTYNELARKMISGIKEHGGESSWVKSADFQAMKVSLEAAVAELHDAYGITSFREPTVKFFESMATAGVDPTSFIYNATTALKTSAENLQSKVNAKLVAANYDGKPLSFAPLEPPAGTSQADQDLTQLKDNRDDNMIRRLSATALQASGASPDAVAQVSGLAPKLTFISTLAQRVDGRGPDANDAASMLAKIVANPDIAAPVRDAAERALSAAVAKRQAGSFAASDKSFSTVRPDDASGKIPDIIQRINTPPALHPTLTPTHYPGQPPGS